jgi:PadR family transcriptional regulator PadR
MTALRLERDGGNGGGRGAKDAAAKDAGPNIPRSTRSIDLPQGTLDLLILRTLALEPQHGWAISERIQQISSDVLRIQQGSLYPALHRLERRAWIKAKWGTSENNRKAKYYELTKSGRRQLELEKDAWEKLAAAVAQVLTTA